MKFYKGIITFFLFLLCPTFVFASSSADIYLSGNSEVKLGEEFSIDVGVRNIVGSNIMSVGGDIVVEDSQCFRFVRLEKVVADANNNRFVYLDMDGTMEDFVFVKAIFQAENQSCSTNINIEGLNYMFTDFSTVTSPVISKTITVANHLEHVSLNPPFSVNINREAFLSLPDVIGQAYSLRYTTNSNVTDKIDSVWNSSNPNVATIDSNGVLSVLGSGETKIQVSVTSHETGRTFTDFFLLHVLVPTTGVQILDQPFSLFLEGNNHSRKLNVLVNPTNTTEAITYSSDKPNVVQVSSDGVVSAVGLGSATITVTSGSFSDTIVVEVNQLIIDVPKYTLNANHQESLSLTAKLLNSSTISGTIEWKSSEPEYAEVSANGVVRALKASSGEPKEVLITATWISNSNPTYREEITSLITIVAPIEDLVLETTKVLLSDQKPTFFLNAIINPSITTDDSTLHYESSNPNVVQVTNEGVLKAVGNGTALVTVTTSNGISQVCEVVVENFSNSVIWLEHFSIVGKNQMAVGEQMTLQLSFQPTHVTEPFEVEYFSSDESIATVDSTGNVVAKKEGFVTITVRINGKEETHQIVIKKVVHPKTGLSSIQASMILVLLSLVGIGFSLFKKYQLL